MAIQDTDIKIYRGAKRDQTETAGGLPSGVVVVDGVVNNLFQNISRIDRTRGEITLEKLFVGVASANTDTYKGSFMAVCDPPFDPNVNVMLVKSPSYASERADVIAQLESFYDLSSEAGNAKLAYSYQPGAEKILYLLRWYEYTPRYAADGMKIMSTKYDLKASMNISVGDIVWLGDASKSNGEYIEVAGVRTLYEAMPDPDADHYYNKVYLEVLLASPLANQHFTTDVTRRTSRNPAWEVFGCMRLKSPLSPMDAYASVSDITGRLVPVIEKTKLVTGQVVYQPAVLKNDVTIEAGDITLEMAQVKQTELSESVTISGQSVSHTFAYGPVDPATVVFRYRHQKRWIVSESDSGGLLSGDVTGAVFSSGKAMSLTLALAPDPGTVGIVTFLTQHQYEVCSSSNLLTANIVGSKQTEIRNIAAGISSYSVALAGSVPCRLIAGLVKIYALVDGAYDLVAQDDLFGALGGSLSGTVNYALKTVNITSFGTVVTRTLKFEFEVELYRKRLFTQDDFTISADGLTYTLDVGGAIVCPPAGAVDLYSHMTMVFDTLSSPSGTPVSGSYSLPFSTIPYYSTQDEVEIGSMAGTKYVRLGINVGGWTVDRTVMQFAPVVNYVNGTISFTLDAGVLPPLGSSPDVALKSISVEVIVTDDGSYGNELPMALHFNKTGLVPGGITGVIVSPLGVLSFYDNKQGVLKLKQIGLSGVADTTLTDGIPAGYVYLQDICRANTSLLATVKNSSNATAIIMSVNNGISWQYLSLYTMAHSGRPRCAYGLNNGVAYYVYTVKYFSGNSIYACIYFSSNGATWNHVEGSLGMNEVLSICFGNNVAVFAFTCGGTEEIRVNSDRFATIGTVVVSSISESAFGICKDIKFGKDGDGQGRFVCVFSLGKIIYGDGSIVGANWKYGLLPWSDDSLWLEFSNETNIWVCVGGSKKIARSTDGAIWDYVSTSFLDGDDTALYGLAVSDDGLFVISGTAGRYSSRDGENWAEEAVHPVITTNDQYLISFCDGAWVEICRDPETLTISAISQDQQEVPSIVDVGTVDYETGEGGLTEIEDILTVSSTMYLAERAMNTFAVHTNGADPVTPGTFQLECRAVSGRTLTCVGDDATGELSGDASGTYNPEHGFAYGAWSEPYYPETLVMDSGYKSVYHPEFSGINEKAFPLNGRVPLVKKNTLAMITDKGSYKLSAPIDADDMILVLDDLSGWPPVMPDPCLIEIGNEILSVESRDGNSLVISAAGRGFEGTTASAHAKGSIVFLTTFNMELNPVAAVQSGTIQFANDVAHSYSEGAVVSAVIESGDLQAILGEYHTQESWLNSTWVNANEYAGNPAGGVYNFPDHPMVLTNLGAVTERWIIRITSSSPLLGEIRGEKLGVIASNVPLTSNVTPINPNVNAPYFWMEAAGFSGGWQVGNILRFNTKGALSPAWAVRVVEAKASTASDDGAEIWIGGDVPVA